MLPRTVTSTVMSKLGYSGSLTCVHILKNTVIQKHDFLWTVNRKLYVPVGSVLVFVV